MKGTLDVKGVDKWAVYLVVLWAERNLMCQPSLLKRVQEIGNGLTCLVLQKLLPEVTAHHFHFISKSEVSSVSCSTRDREQC